MKSINDQIKKMKYAQQMLDYVAKNGHRGVTIREIEKKINTNRKQIERILKKLLLYQYIVINSVEKKYYHEQEADTIIKINEQSTRKVSHKLLLSNYRYKDIHMINLEDKTAYDDQIRIHGINETNIDLLNSKINKKQLFEKDTEDIKLSSLIKKTMLILNYKIKQTTYVNISELVKNQIKDKNNYPNLNNLFRNNIILLKKLIADINLYEFEIDSYFLYLETDESPLFNSANKFYYNHKISLTKEYVDKAKNDDHPKIIQKVFTKKKYSAEFRFFLHKISKKLNKNKTYLSNDYLLLAQSKPFITLISDPSNLQNQ